MKKYLILFLAVALWSCNDNDDGNFSEAKILQAQTLLNVSYGSDPQQVADIYLPERKNDHSTKVLFLVHGGGWSGGSKEDMNAAVAVSKTLFPNYALVNVGYRLATTESPAYPKQMNDLKAVVAHIANSDYAVSEDYAFLGISAGGHLSMLYAYAFDPDRHVKAVCNIVGPTDFNDPAYTENPLVQDYFENLGTEFTTAFLSEVSPVTHISAQSAPTIQFMGNADPLIPTSQGTRLKARLDSFGITNELNIYNAGHGNFSATDSQEIYSKLSAFFAAHL